MRSSLIAGISCALLAVCAMGAEMQGTSGRASFGTWGVELTSLDKSVRPGNDFYLYANGSWLATAQIPPDRTSTGSFQDLQILSENRMQDLMNGIEAKPYASLSPEEKQLRDLYDAFVDTKAIDARGLKPAKRDLAYFANLKTYDDVARAMGEPGRATDRTRLEGFPHLHTHAFAERPRHAGSRLLSA